MTRPPKSKKPAAGPVDAMGQTLERALDPLTSVLKRAGLARAEKSAAAAGPASSSTASPIYAAAPIWRVHVTPRPRCSLVNQIPFG